VGTRFFRVSANYPVPEIPDQYMNVFKTLTTLNDGQQRLVDNFSFRANLERLFKDSAISSGDYEDVKEAAIRYFVEEKHVLEYLRHL
jgi:hypothetical protein